MNLLRPLRILAVAGLAWPILHGLPARGQEGANVRPAYFAGGWYPKDPAQLKTEIDDLLAKARPTEIHGRPIAVIAPHAGYRYCAPVSTAAYAALRGQKFKRVIVLAFSHRHAHEYRGVDVPKELTAYSTPLGQVPIDRDVCTRLLENPVFSSHPGLDRDEHSLELQLPYLQRTLTEFSLVPLLVGELSDRECAEAAQALARCVDEDTLLVASSDFTHFGPNYGYQPFKEDVPDKLRELAEQAAAPISRCDYDGFVEHLGQTQDTICGRGPIRLLLRVLSMQGGAEGVRAAYNTSGNLVGDWTNSVTYQSFVFTRHAGTLSPQDRTELLHIARQTVAAFLAKQETPKVKADDLAPALRADGACFVTLENHGQLRGCIGNMVADGPLYESVIRNAISACRDPRFVNDPITAKELPELHIEISYLTPMQRVGKPEEIIIGRHGLLISLGGRRGVLLPQVAYERGWTRDEFLAQTCRKAGLPPNAWRDPAAELYSFQAEVFGEPE